MIGQFSPFLCQLWIEANMWSRPQSPTRICLFSLLFFCLIGSNTNKKEQGFGKWPKFGINVVMKCMKLLLPYEIPNGDNNITILHRSNFNASSALHSIFTKQASLNWIFLDRDGLAECEKPRFHIFWRWPVKLLCTNDRRSAVFLQRNATCFAQFGRVCHRQVCFLTRSWT